MPQADPPPPSPRRQRVSLKARVAKARAARDKASDAIFAFAAHGQMRWSECYARATQEAREAYDRADDALRSAESAAVSAGRAYRASFGLLVWTR